MNSLHSCSGEGPLKSVVASTTKSCYQSIALFAMNRLQPSNDAKWNMHLCLFFLSVREAGGRDHSYQRQGCVDPTLALRLHAGRVLGERASKKVWPVELRKSFGRMGQARLQGLADSSSGRLSTPVLLASTAVNQRGEPSRSQALPRISDESKETLKCHPPLGRNDVPHASHAALRLRVYHGSLRRYCVGLHKSPKETKMHECIWFTRRCVDAHISVLGSRWSIFSVQGLL